jgi:hypothetical protein
VQRKVRNGHGKQHSSATTATAALLIAVVVMLTGRALFLEQKVADNEARLDSVEKELL